MALQYVGRVGIFDCKYYESVGGVAVFVFAHLAPVVASIFSFLEATKLNCGEILDSGGILLFPCIMDPDILHM